MDVNADCARASAGGICMHVCVCLIVQKYIYACVYMYIHIRMYSGL